MHLSCTKIFIFVIWNDLQNKIKRLISPSVFHKAEIGLQKANSSFSAEQAKEALESRTTWRKNSDLIQFHKPSQEAFLLIRFVIIVTL